MKGEIHGPVNVRCAGKQGGPRRMKEDYFTVIELARKFTVNPKTIHRRLWAKGIPAYKIIEDCEKGYYLAKAITEPERIFCSLTTEY